jgi:hypothetical protein
MKKKPGIPWRNTDCRFYLECLDKAARIDALDLGCGQCEYKNDKGRALDVSQLDPADIAGMMALVRVIRFPKRYRDF